MSIARLINNTTKKIDASLLPERAGPTLSVGTNFAALGPGVVGNSGSVYPTDGAGARIASVPFTPVVGNTTFPPQSPATQIATMIVSEPGRYLLSALVTFSINAGDAFPMSILQVSLDGSQNALGANFYTIASEMVQLSTDGNGYNTKTLGINYVADVTSSLLANRTFYLNAIVCKSGGVNVNPVNVYYNVSATLVG